MRVCVCGGGMMGMTCEVCRMAGAAGWGVGGVRIQRGRRGIGGLGIKHEAILYTRRRCAGACSKCACQTCWLVYNKPKLSLIIALLSSILGLLQTGDLPLHPSGPR